MRTKIIGIAIGASVLAAFAWWNLSAEAKYHEGFPGWFAPANSTVVCENERRGRFVLETEESQPWRADIEERFGGVPLKTDYAMSDANCRAFRFRWLAEWYAGESADG